MRDDNGKISMPTSCRNHQRIILWYYYRSKFQPFFRKSPPNWTIFYDFHHYITPYYVIGHDVTGHPDMRADNSGLGLSIIENRLVIAALQMK